MFDRLRPIAWLAPLALAVAGASAATAQVCPLRVDPAGGGDFTDIQAAVDYFKASLGNRGPCTIEVAPGEYTNSVAIDGINTGNATTPAASSDGERLVLRGTRGAAGQWLSAFNTGRRDAVKVKGSRFVSIEDFAVLGGTNKPIAIEGGNAGAVNLAITAARNNIHDNGGGRDSGCVFVADGNQQVWVVNNVCWSNHSENIVVGKGGGPNFVVNNTILDSEKSGISVAKTANVVIANNLVLFTASANGAGIDLSTSGGGAVGTRRLLHNIVYGSGASGDITNRASATQDVGNQTTAPGSLGAGLLATDFLEDPGSANFHLAASSPALNAGIASTGVPNRVPGDDFEGDPRSDAAPDVGFDEVADADHDGVPDLADNCPPGLNSSYNPAQGDADGDGVGNYCDNCPTVANPDQADVSGLDAFGNFVAGPNERGDACEGVGESLFDVSSGPADDILFVATFGVHEPTDTVPPTCQCNTYFYCEDSAGNPLPRTHNFCSRGIPDDLVSYAVGSLVTVFCPLPDLFPTAAFADGTYTCRACYDNEHRDLELNEDGSCSGSECVENFEGIACSGPQQLVIDSTKPHDACSPGYWKNNTGAWGPTGFAPGDDFDASLGVALFDPDRTLLEALGAGGGDADALGRHAAAGLLSASHPDVNYPYSVDVIRALVQAGDPDGRLAAASTLGCPLSGSN